LASESNSNRNAKFAGRSFFCIPLSFPALSLGLMMPGFHRFYFTRKPLQEVFVTGRNYFLMLGFRARRLSNPRRKAPAQAMQVIVSGVGVFLADSECR
jgi:hypothetical protein